MARSARYVIFGATGHVGGVVADRLLGAGQKVYVVGRNADRLQALAQRGAEVATGDMGDAAFVRRALDGAHAAFALVPPYFGPGIRAWQEVAARRLLALDWEGVEVQELHGQRDLTMAEATAALGAAIGRPDLRYVQLPEEDAKRGMMQAGMPEEMVDLLLEMAKGLNEGHMRALQPRSASRTTPTSIEEWARDAYAPAYRAAGGAEAQPAHPK